MRMSAALVADISDRESRLAKFKLLFGSAEKKNMDIVQLMPQMKAFKIFCLDSECFSMALATTCQFFRALFFRRTNNVFLLIWHSHVWFAILSHNITTFTPVDCSNETILSILRIAFLQFAETHMQSDLNVQVKCYTLYEPNLR